jgi:hypothetical protein
MNGVFDLGRGQDFILSESLLIPVIVKYESVVSSEQQFDSDKGDILTCISINDISFFPAVFA